MYVYTYIHMSLPSSSLLPPLLFSFSTPSLLWFAASGSDVPFPLVCRKFPSLRTRFFLRILFYVSYFFLFSRFSVIVLLRGEAFRCVEQIWSNSNFESSKHSIGSGSGPASSVFKNCKFFFFFPFCFFCLQKFRFDSKFSSSKQNDPVCSSVFKNYPCAFFFSFAGAIGDSFPLRFFVRLFLCCVEGFKFARFFFFGRDFIVRVMK
jgi:hypothetical protein